MKQWLFVHLADLRHAPLNNRILQYHAGIISFNTTYKPFLAASYVNSLLLFVE